MLKKALLTIAISLSACSSLPPFPEHTQYGVHADISPSGFYGVNSKTKAKVFRGFQDPSMKGAQCVDLRDYRKIQNWIKQVKEIAEQKCQ